MKNAKETIIERFTKMGKEQRLVFIDIFRVMYNNLCRDCQLKVGRMQGRFSYELLCDDCRVFCKAQEERINEVLSP